MHQRLIRGTSWGMKRPNTCSNCSFQFKGEGSECWGGGGGRASGTGLAPNAGATITPYLLCLSAWLRDEKTRMCVQ